jgi:long-chain acyl-CoA synthetase
LVVARTPHPGRRPGDEAGDEPADEIRSYRDMDERTNRLAHLFRSAGLVAGDHVAILMENRAAFLETAWAAQRSGLYYTALNSHLRGGEVQYILDDCGARLLVTSSAMAGVVSTLDLSRVATRLVVGGPLDGFDEFETALAVHPATPIPDECEGREMLYSSGTTGRPKGVRKELPRTAVGDPSAAPVQIALALSSRGAGSGAVYLSPAPLYHSAPLVYCLSMMRVGATVVVMDRFDPVQCLALIERHHVTHAQFVPTMFVRLLQLPDEVRRRYDISSLRSVVHAAAPCPVAVKRRMIDWWGPIIDEYYAGTEDIGSTWITAAEWLAHPGSVGRPMTPAHIVGPDGADLGPGEEGVVYFEGGRPFEYHNDPDKTASAHNERGWRTLGDIGRMDEDGYLYLTDRQAHMIIAGGVNIYPQEVEHVLIEHPAVADVAVIGVPDPDMGEAVKAVVEPVRTAVTGAALETELIAFCREHLAAFKCPRTVDFVDELPRDPNGKLYKRILRERYWEGHDTRVV